MADKSRLVIYAVVEGTVDEIVVRRLLKSTGDFDLSGVFGRKGKDWIKQKIEDYNNAARFSNWFVLVDLDAEEVCAPKLISKWMPEPAPFMFFRVAVRSIESWLLADRDQIAGFLGVHPKNVPKNPESLPDPKESMIQLVRKSKNSEIREDMLPREGSGRKTGPAYTSRLIEFINHQSRGWRLDVAAQNSDSLGRCLKGIQNWRKKRKK